MYLSGKVPLASILSTKKKKYVQSMTATSIAIIIMMMKRIKAKNFSNFFKLYIDSK